nr:ATP synthase F0 subunit 6 [Punctum randolphii]
MNTDLFSSLDGCSSLWSWMIPLLVTYITLMNISWASYPVSFLKYSFSSMWKGEDSHKPLWLFLYSIMLFFVLNNLIGLTPFTYSMTSSLWSNSALALLMWATLIISGWVKDIKSSVAHLAPMGAPMALMPFLIIIETVSIFIRPLTLTVRLVANMSAGHIVLSLIANSLSSSLSISSTSLVYLLMAGYVLFEFFVSVIQAYIFTLLISLYSQEHP